MIRLRMLAASLAIAAAGLGLAAQSSAKNSPQETIEEASNRKLVAAGFEAWRNGTGSPYDLLAADVSWIITGNSVAAKTYPSKEAFLSEVIRPFNARMRSGLVPTVRRLYAEGDTVIALFDAQGPTRDGQIYANSYAWFLQMKDGQIVKAVAFFDSITFDAFWHRVPLPDGQ